VSEHPNRRVLVLEDDEAQRGVLQGYLDRANWESIGVGSLQETRAHLGTGLCAVLVDLHLPGYSGVNIVRDMRPIVGPWVPLVVVTGSQDLGLEAECLRAGASVFMRKDEIIGDSGARLTWWLRNRVAEDACRLKAIPGEVERASVLLAVQDLGAIGGNMQGLATEAVITVSRDHENILRALRPKEPVGIIRVFREWGDPVIRTNAIAAARDTATLSAIVVSSVTAAIAGFLALDKAGLLEALTGSL